MASQNTGLNILVNATTSGFTRQVNSAFSKVPKGINVPISLPLGRVTGEVKQFEKSLDAATARVIAFTATTRILSGVSNAFQRITADAIKVEAAMARISSILKTTTAETKQLQSSLFQLANKTSTSFYEVAEAAEEFSRQGLGVKKTLEATNAALVVSILSGSKLKTTIEGITSIITTFSGESLEFVDIANKLSALDAKFATSAAGLIEGLKRVGGVASDAGVSLDQAAAAITVLKQVTGRSEAVLGNSLKSIFTRLQSSNVQKELKTIGVEVADSAGEFRNLTDVITELSTAFDSLNDSQKANITQKVAGTYQANAFSGLIKSFKDSGQGQGSLFQKAEIISKNSENEANDRLEKIYNTTQSGLVRLNNLFTEFGAAIGDKLTKPFLDYLGRLTETFSKIESSFGGVGANIGNALLSGISNVLQGPGLILATAVLFQFSKKILTDSFGAIKNILGVKKAQDGVTAATYETAQFLPKISEEDFKRIARLTTIAAKENEILAILNKQFLAYQAIATGQAQYVGIVNSGRIVNTGTKFKTKASGHVPEQMAMIREHSDIQKGVGGARPTARPIVKMLNVGRGIEKVVVNSDEKIIRNFGGSGEDAILNRQMMGFSRGRLPNLAGGTNFIGPTKRLIRNMRIPITREEGGSYFITTHLGASRINISRDKGSSPIATLLHESGHYYDSKKNPLNPDLKYTLSHNPNISKRSIGKLERKAKKEFEIFKKKKKKDPRISLSNSYYLKKFHIKLLEKGIAYRYGGRYGETPTDVDRSPRNITSGYLLERERRANKEAVKLLKKYNYSDGAIKTFIKQSGENLKTYTYSRGPRYNYPGLRNISSGFVPNLASAKNGAMMSIVDPGTVERFAGGRIPSSTLLGRGAFGEFYKYDKKPDLGYKTFHESKFAKSDIESEFKKFQLLEQSKKSLPGYIDTVKLIGNPSRSISRNRLGKTIAPGKVMAESDAWPLQATIGNLLQNTLRHKGRLKVTDLYGENFSINAVAEKALLPLAKLYTSPSNIKNTTHKEKIIYKAANRVLSRTPGAKVTIFDPGTVEQRASGHIPRNRRFKRKIRNIARGYIPNFANGSGLSRKQMRAMLAAGYSADYIRKYSEIYRKGNRSRSPRSGSSMSSLPSINPSSIVPPPKAIQPIPAPIAPIKAIPAPIAPIQPISRPVGLSSPFDPNPSGFSSSLSSQSQSFIDRINMREDARLEKEQLRQARKENARRIGAGVAGAGFATSFAGGVLGESFRGPDGESTKAQRLTSEGSNLAGMAASFAGISPVVGIVAGVAAGFGILMKVGKEASSNLDGFASAQKFVNQEIQKNQAAFENYGQTFASLNQAIEDGNTKAIPGLKKALGSFLTDISDSRLRSKLKGAKNIEEIQSIGIEQGEIDKKRKAEADLGLSMAKNIQENMGAIDQLKNFFLQDESSLGKELLTGGGGIGSGKRVQEYALQSSKSVDIDALDENAKLRLSAGKNISYKELLSSVDRGSQLYDALLERGEGEFNKSQFSESLSKELRGIIDASNLAGDITSKKQASVPFQDFLRNSTLDINTDAAEKQEKFSSSLDILAAKMENLSLSDGGKLAASYGLDKTESLGKFQKSRQDLDLGLIRKTSELLQSQNLDPINTARSDAAIRGFAADGDFTKFTKELKDIFGPGFTSELETLSKEDLLARRSLAIQEKTSLETASAIFKQSRDKLRATQASNLFGGAGGTIKQFDETIQAYKDNLPMALKDRAENKVPIYRGWNSEIQPNRGLDRRRARRDVEVLDENAARGEAIISKVKIAQESGLAGIDLSDDASPELVRAKKQEIKRLRAQAKEGYKDISQRNLISGLGQITPTQIANINDRFKKSTANNVPLISAKLQEEIQTKLSGGKIKDALSLVQKNRGEFLSQFGGRGYKGESGISSAFDELEALLKNGIGNQEVLDLGAEENARNLVRDKSLPQEMVDELRKLQQIETDSRNSLKTLEDAIKIQNKSAETSVAMGLRDSIAPKLAELQKKEDAIKQQNKPVGSVTQERTELMTKLDEAVKNRQRAIKEIDQYDKNFNNLDTSKNAVETGADVVRRARLMEEAEYFKNEEKTISSRLLQEEKDDALRKRDPDDGRAKLRKIDQERQSLRGGADSQYGDYLNQNVAPLMEEFKPLIKSLEGLKNLFGNGTSTSTDTKVSADFGFNINVNGSDIIKSPEFQQALAGFIEKEVTKQVIASNGTPPRLIPNKQTALA